MGNIFTAILGMLMVIDGPESSVRRTIGSVMLGVGLSKTLDAVNK